MHSRDLVILAALLSIGAEPARNSEYWEVAHLDGVKIGSMHTTFAAGEGIVHSTAVFDLALRRGNAVLKLRMEQGTDETPEGRVVAVSMRQEQGTRQLVLSGKLEDGKMHVQIDDGRIDRRLRWSDDVVGLYGREQLFAKHKRAPGDRFEVQAFDPEVNAVVNLRVAVKEPEEVNVLGVRKKLLRVELVPDKLEGPGFSVQRPRTVLWLDDAFVAVRRQIELDGLGAVILTRTSREIATAAPGRAPTQVLDINTRNLVPLNRTISGTHTARAAVYRVTLRDDPDPASAFVTDGHQEVKNVRGQSFEIVVHPVRPTSPRSADAPGPELLGSSHFIDTDAPILRELARRAGGGEKDNWQRAQRIERWVKSAMRVDNSLPLVPASQVARDLRGDCRQYAMLTAALCRAEGIPARTALGLVYVEKSGRPFLGFHMWTEVWVAGQWRGLDACLGPGGVGVGHVKVSDHSWHDTPSQTPLLPVGRVLGKMSVEVVRVEE